MLITRRNPFTGEHHTREIAILEHQLNAWKQGALIQDAAPHLSADEREFIISGILPDQWNDLFGKD